MSDGERLIRAHIEDAQKIIAKAINTRFSNTRFDRDDMIGNAMLFLLQNAHSYKPTVSSLSNWCWHTAEMAVLRMMQTESYDCRKTLNEAISLDFDVLVQGNAHNAVLVPLVELIGDPAQDTEGDAVRAADYERALDAVRALPDWRMVKIMMERYATDSKPRKLREIAADLGISKERCRQIESDALYLLREALGVKK